MINFEPKDFKNEYYSQVINNLLGFLVSLSETNKNFESMIFEFIPSFYDVDALNPKDDNYQLLQLWVEAQEDVSAEDKRSFIAVLNKLYSEIVKQTDDKNVHKKLFGVIRGMLLEKMLTMKLSVKYRNNRIPYDVGCQVVVNRKPICSDSLKENMHKKITVDFAGVNKTALRGEFYEFKVGPKYFDKTTFEILKNIRERIHNDINPQYVLNTACYVCDDEDAVNRKIIEWGLDDTIQVYSKLSLEDMIGFKLVS